MRADSLGAKGTGLLLALALLFNACVSLTPPPGPGRSLRYTLHDAMGPVGAGGAGEESPLLWQSALAAHLAFRKGVGEVSGTTRRISRELSRLKASNFGIAGAGNGIFVRYVDYGEAQLRWIDSELAAATELATEASEVEDLDMQPALLRLAGPRLEAAVMGSLLLAVWFDFLNLTDATLKRGFTGKMRIDWFCVTLQQPHHQAIHGGGNWKLGREWRGEWNQMIMKALRDAEIETGRMLTRNEILEIVAARMRFYDIPMNFVRCRGK